MGLRTMRMEPQDEHRLCIKTRVKPCAIVVPHNKWVSGAWTDRETGELLPPPKQGQTYMMDLNVSSGGDILVAYPTQQW